MAAATLSHRYISDRFLPDKAIDLVDEACAVIRTEIDSMPQELDAITRRVMRLEIEEAALAQGERRRQQGAARGAAQGARRPARRRRDAMTRPVGGRAPGHPQAAGAPRGARAGAARDRGGRARLRPQPRGRAAPRASCPSSSSGSHAEEERLDEQQGGHAAAARGGDRGGDRRGRRPLDGHPGHAG